jgi:4-hydroxybenzoate polyprenyltransferase/phosphoserine phosphatase
VDLDGTLIYSDMLWESLARLLKQNFLYIFAVPIWALSGRANLKRQVAARTTVNPALLPYNEAFLQFLREEKARGRRLVLASASEHALVEKVAGYVGLFDEVLASDGRTNLRSAAKCAALIKKFGRGGFDYAGNSSADLAVWAATRKNIVVNAPAALAARVRNDGRVAAEFAGPPERVRAIWQALRPHQWVKNIIIFVPLITAHKVGNAEDVQASLLAFAAFCLFASGVYVLNDLSDLESDRQHARKRNRPLASGRLYLPWAFVGGPLLLIVPTVLSLIALPRFAVVLLAYGVITTAYTLRLKEVAILDVFVLAGLYTMRLVAGHVATGIEFSSWLLGFSMFIFLSLAMMKRLQELQSLRDQNLTGIKGRGYLVGDLQMVNTFGVTSGYLSVIVMALYVNSDQVSRLYHHPGLLLLVCPLLLYWISRVWLITHRGQLHDDPVLFAIKDRQSYIIGALALLLVWLAT